MHNIFWHHAVKTCAWRLHCHAALADLNSVDILCNMFDVELVGFTTLKIYVRTQVGLGLGLGR